MHLLNELINKQVLGTSQIKLGSFHLETQYLSTSAYMVSFT